MTKDHTYIAASLRFAESCRKLIESGDPHGYFFASFVEAADRYYAAFDSPSNPPLAVKRAIVQYFMDDLPRATSVLLTLRRHNIENCWSFDHAGMFVGIEPDGFLHS